MDFSCVMWVYLSLLDCESSSNEALDFPSLKPPTSVHLDESREKVVFMETKLKVWAKQPLLEKGRGWRFGCICAFQSLATSLQGSPGARQVR